MTNIPSALVMIPMLASMYNRKLVLAPYFNLDTKQTFYIEGRDTSQMASAAYNPGTQYPQQNLDWVAPRERYSVPRPQSNVPNASTSTTLPLMPASQAVNQNCPQSIGPLPPSPLPAIPIGELQIFQREVGLEQLQPSICERCDSSNIKIDNIQDF